MSAGGSTRLGDAAAHAKAMAALGAAHAGPGEAGRRKRTVAEGKVARALGLAALRQRDEGKLDAVISAFGGLGAESLGKDDPSDLLWEAAGEADAFGFAKIYAACEEDGMRVHRGLGEASEAMGPWLRAGLICAGRLRGADHVNSLICSASEMAERQPCPVGACLDRDNPVALAIILSDPKRFAALAAAEPQGSVLEEPPSGEAAWSAATAVKADAFVEKTLLWQAASMRAVRCAAMLASIPEFSQAALTPGRLAYALSTSMPPIRPVPGGHGASRPLGSADPVPCVFETATRALARMSEGYSPRDESRRPAAQGMLLALVAAAPPEAKSSVDERGRGWAEVAADAATQGRWDKAKPEKVAALMELFSAMGAAGFEVDWGKLAKRWDEGSPTREWLEIHGASAQASSKPRPMAL